MILASLRHSQDQELQKVCTHVLIMSLLYSIHCKLIASENLDLLSCMNPNLAKCIVIFRIRVLFVASYVFQQWYQSHRLVYVT